MCTAPGYLLGYPIHVSGHGSWSLDKTCCKSCHPSELMSLIHRVSSRLDDNYERLTCLLTRGPIKVGYSRHHIYLNGPHAFLIFYSDPKKLTHPLSFPLRLQKTSLRPQIFSHFFSLDRF